MESFKQDNIENKEYQKLKYLILDFTSGEPVVLDQFVTDDPDSFVEAFEQKTGKKFEDNPQWVVANEDPSESTE